MAMMSAYFDESTSESSPIIVVAGFLSTDVEWALFETEWKDVLAEFGISAFHMHCFAHRKDEFAGMPEPRRKALLGKLLNIITKRVKLGFASVVHWREFESVFTGADRDYAGSPYNLACTACQLDIGEWAQRNDQAEPIAYFYDAGHKDAAEVARIFLETKNQTGRNEYRLGSITFEHDNVLVPLQAADIAAYEFWRWLHEHFADTTRHGRYPLEKLVEIEWNIRSFDRLILEEMLARKRGAKVVPRVIRDVIPALRSGKTAPPQRRKL